MADKILLESGSGGIQLENASGNILLEQSDLTLAITGVATGSTAVGTVVQDTAGAITGLQATGGVGSATPSSAAAITGIPATASAGSPGVEVDSPISGLSASSAVGSIDSWETDLAIEGLEAQSSLGAILISGQDAVAAQQAETPAGRKTRIRSIYRVSIDGQKFEFRSLADALAFLQKAKQAAAQLAAEAARTATEKQRQSIQRVAPPRLKVPEIGISSRELRKAAAETKREIGVIYQAAVRDAEIAMLMELNRRAEDDDEALTWLMN